MNSSHVYIYVALVVLTLAAVAFAAIALWNHKKLNSFGYLSLSIIIGGILLNVLKLTHTDVAGNRFSWASLPDWAYDYSLIIGMVMLLVWSGLKQKADKALQRASQESDEDSALPQTSSAQPTLTH